MALGWTLLVIVVLAVAVILLNRKARRSNYGRFRSHRSRRKYRVPVSDVEAEEANGERTP